MNHTIICIFYFRELHEKFLLGKQSHSLQDCLNKSHLDDFYHENKNQFFSSNCNSYVNNIPGCTYID